MLVYLATRGMAHSKYVATVHGSDAGKLGSRSVGAALARRAYVGATKVFANSQATKEIFQRNMADSVEVQVTYLGLNREWMRRPEASFRSSQLAAFVAAGTVISTVGRVEPRKGQLNAIRALSLLRAAGHDELRYVIAGPIIDDSYVGQLVDAANALKVPTLIAGKIDREDVRRLYAVSRCHVLAAVNDNGRIEGFGLSLLEAAAQGCASVASRIGGIPEAVIDGTTGLLCAEGDITTLTDALRAIVERPVLRMRLSAQAIAHAQSFTWDRCARDSYSGIFCTDWQQDVDPRSSHQRYERQRLAGLEQTIDQTRRKQG
jgi:phosphatidylinositol alpha-1,6-mannosyltransferase